MELDLTWFNCVLILDRLKRQKTLLNEMIEDYDIQLNPYCNACFKDLISYYDRLINYFEYYSGKLNNKI